MYKFYWILGIIILFLLIASQFVYLPELPFWKYIDTGATLLTLILVFFDFMEREKENDLITVKFRLKSLNDKEIEIKPFTVRKLFSRQELQGLIANKLIKGVSRYDIAYLGNEKYFIDIHKIQTADKKELVIDLEENEIAQFADEIIVKLDDEDIKKITPSIKEFIETKNTPPQRELKKQTWEKLDAV